MRTNTLRSNWGTIARCGSFLDCPSVDRKIRDGAAGDLRTARNGRNLPSPREIRLRMEIARLNAALDPVARLRADAATTREQIAARIRRNKAVAARDQGIARLLADAAAAKALLAYLKR